MKKMNKKGFTIVELVIVIAVIAILAAVLIPTFSGIVTKAQESAALQEARNKFTEAYADDISDGTINYKIGTTDMTTSSHPGYSVDTSGATPVAKFTYTKNDVTVEYNGTAWSVDE